MHLVYAKAAQKFQKGDYIDCSNLKYTMTPDTYRKWLESKTACNIAFKQELDGVLEKASIKKIFQEALKDSNTEEENVSYTFEETYLEKMQELAMPKIEQRLKERVQQVFNKAISNFKKVME